MTRLGGSFREDDAAGGEGDLEKDCRGCKGAGMVAVSCPDAGKGDALLAVGG